MKKQIWTSDWFFALVFSLLFAVAAYWLLSDFFQSIERTAYDSAVRLTEREPSDRVAVVAIDDESIENIGRWPWGRDVHAAMIDRLTQGGADAIGYTVLFVEPQQDPGLGYIQEVRELVGESSLDGDATEEIQRIESYLSSTAGSVPETDSLEPGENWEDSLKNLAGWFRGTSLATQLSGDLQKLREELAKAETALNTDRVLAESLAESGRTALAMNFVLGEPLGRPDRELPDPVLANAIYNVVGGDQNRAMPLPTREALPPIPELAKNAAAIGHVNTNLDVDGAQRFDHLVLRYYDYFFPSIALSMAKLGLNLQREDVQIRLGESVRLGNLTIRTTPDLRMRTHFYTEKDGDPPFPVDSFYDVFTGRIPASKYEGKLVLVGATATGVGDSFPTPVSPSMAPVLTLAHTLSSILQEDFFTRPEWASMAEAGVFAVIALYLILLLPRLPAGWATALSGTMLVALIATHYVAMTSEAMWLKLMIPAVFLVTGHILVTIKRLRVTERLRTATEAESAESNRMLGLALQGQGQLDMAFDKFRRCPVDARMLDLLYNLGLDYERKRQFSKAAAVYRYMAEHDANYRDIQDRIQRSDTMEQTAMLGTGGGSGPATLTLSDDDSVQKPMLGRYEVEKELGKGAMGAVYQGRDPKINRVVAIKTMALAQEFEADELDDVKSRFFREAETAGRLSHPNIVTIYDAGEEQDLAYIAMEYLKGKDLTAYVKPDNLLPVPVVFDIIARSADALSYAHRENIVHRDIKPANVMYEPETGEIKVTDFGIARITDSSKTKTGMVLGTPSYMSPEQLSGKKVDGRSDLFSLGVMFYQMLTGQLPFHADSMATLMYKITNEQHGDITVLRPDLPECVKPIIDRLLAKDADDRYQEGAQVAEDIRACASQLNGEGGTADGAEG